MAGDDSFQAILHEAGFACDPASPEFLAWLEAGKAPREIIDLLAPGLPRKQKRRRRLRDRWDLYTEREIRQESDSFPHHLKAGLLPFASCLNGDPVAIDLRKRVGAVGYISHDEVWEDDEARIRSFFAIVAPSLAEFARLAREKLLPIDYYEARGRK